MDNRAMTWKYISLVIWTVIANLLLDIAAMDCSHLRASIGKEEEEEEEEDTADSCHLSNVQHYLQKNL